VTAVIRPSWSAVLAAVDGFVPGWICSEGTVPVRYGMSGARPVLRRDGAMVGVHCEPTGLVVNAWSPRQPAVTILPVGPQGLGLVVPWGTPRPPEHGWWDDDLFQQRLTEGVAAAVDTIHAHLTGTACGASHPVRPDRCARPAGHGRTGPA
jgi:hypothetical protein